MGDPENYGGQENWVPIFDAHNLTMGFENHVHAFKRTRPLVGGRVVKNGGTVYLGDGYWGIAPHNNFRDDAAEDETAIQSTDFFAAGGLRHHVWVLDVDPGEGEVDAK